MAGREHFLSLNPEPLDAAVAWASELKELWAWRLGELEKVLG